MSKASHVLSLKDAGSGAVLRLLRLSAVPALVCLLLLAAGFEGHAQTSTMGLPPRPGPMRGEDDPRQHSGREDMLRNLEVKRREQSYKENIERAKENAALGAEVRQAFERTKSLGSAERKKLGRMEKLSRTIREQAGGDDDKEELKELPASLEASFERLQKLSEELETKVEKTPRHVVSTSVIGTANQLLELIRHLRSSFK